MHTGLTMYPSYKSILVTGWMVITLAHLFKNSLSLDQSEIDALKKIKLKWNVSGWPGEPNCTTWSSHISCNEQGHIISLEIGFAKPELLSGTIPDALCNLTYLEKLALYGNRLSGVIPKCIGNLTQLNYLDFSGNCLGGEIPESLGNLVKMIYFDLSVNAHNDFSFMHRDLCNKSKENNGLTGRIPESLGNMNKVKYFYLSGNKLNDSIPESIGNLTSVVYIYINANELSGSLPRSIGKLNDLQDLQLNKNMISGSIPVEIGNCSSLRIIQINRNRLSGVVPYTIGNLAQLQTLELLSNNLEGRIPEFKTTPVLDMNLFDVRMNNLSGPLPRSFKDAPLRYLFVSNNTYLQGNKNELPDYIVPQYDLSSVIDEKKHFDCPGYQLLPRTFQVTAPLIELDPAYYNYSLCRCRPGYFGTPPDNCHSCLKNGECPRIISGKIQYGTMYFENGFYPATDGNGVVQGFVRCSGLNYKRSPCNPNDDCFYGKNGLQSQSGNCTLCAKGYEGRLCSKCTCLSRNHCFYKNNNECLRCEQISTASKVCYAVGFLLLLIFFALFHESTLVRLLLCIVMVSLVFSLKTDAWLTINVLVVFIVLIPATNTNATSGLVKILIFFLQTVAVIMPAAVSNLLLRLMLSRVSMSNLNFLGVVCLFPEPFGVSKHAILNHFILSLCTPILLFLLIVLFLIIKHSISYFHRRPDSQNSETSLRSEILFTVIFIAYFSFFNASTLVISVFSFSTDPSGLRYLNAFQTICYGNEGWYQLIIASSVGGFVFLLLPLVLFTLLLYKYRQYHDDTTGVSVWLGYLYQSYKPRQNDECSPSNLRKTFWFYSEVFFMLFRFTLAASLSIPDDQNACKSVGVVIVLFAGLALTCLKPFNHPVDNHAAYMTMIVLIFTSFVAQTITASQDPDLSNIKILEWLTVAVNALLLVTICILIMWCNREKIWQNMLKFKKWIGSLKTRIRAKIFGTPGQLLSAIE